MPSRDQDVRAASMKFEMEAVDIDSPQRPMSSQIHATDIPHTSTAFDWESLLNIDERLGPVWKRTINSLSHALAREDPVRYGRIAPELDSGQGPSVNTSNRMEFLLKQSAATLCLLGVAVILLVVIVSQYEPESDQYYDSIDSLEGQQLKDALRRRIADGHQPVSYQSLWENLASIDQRGGCFHDRYSQASPDPNYSMQKG